MAAATTKKKNGRKLAFSDRPIRARFDSAQTTTENRDHWAMSDGLSADASASPAIRQTLRNRTRYETENSPLARRAARALALNAVGLGPTLSIRTADKELRRALKDSFYAWSREVGLGRKLRMSMVTRTRSGECFWIRKNNPTLMGPVKLDYELLEPDQVTSNWIPGMDPDEIDGVHLDPWGNPESYDILRKHPGETGRWSVSPWKSDNWPAEAVIHHFNPERPGQHRGLPELAPALPMFSNLRRFTLATLAASETAAQHAMVMESAAPEAEHQDIEMNLDIGEGNTLTLPEVSLSRRMGMILPQGWKASQMRAEHPTTTYTMFHDAVVAEVASGLDMPFNIAACNSSSYNYSSGQLDYLQFDIRLRIERDDMETMILQRIVMDWLTEALAVGLLPETFTATARAVDPEKRKAWLFQTIIPLIDFFWGRRQHADPTKMASAQAMRLESGMSTYKDELAEDGIDWEEHFEQLALEAEARQKAGLGGGVAVTPAGIDGEGNAAYGVQRKATERPSDEATNGQGQADQSQIANRQSQISLNGIQITAAMEVLDRYRGGKISEVSARTLIAALGIAAADAAEMVKSTQVDKPKEVEDESQTEFKRSVVSSFMADKTIADVIYNVTNIPDLLKTVGIPIDPDVAKSPSTAVPWLPVLDEANRPVTGGVVEDADGDIVGGAVDPTPLASGAGAEAKTQAGEGKSGGMNNDQ